MVRSSDALDGEFLTFYDEDAFFHNIGILAKYATRVKSDRFRR